MLNKFKAYLVNKKLSKASIKNYISDVRQFMTWSANGTFDVTSATAYKNYHSYLLSLHLPPATFNRYLATLRSFGAFLKTEKLLMFNPTIGLENISKDIKRTTKPVNQEQKLLIKFHMSLEKEKLSRSTIKNYLSDVRQFLEFLKT